MSIFSKWFSGEENTPQKDEVVESTVNASDYCGQG